jgi:hypothetical protein
MFPMRKSQEKKVFLTMEVKTILLINNKFFFMFILKDPRIRGSLVSKKQYLKKPCLIFGLIW